MKKYLPDALMTAGAVSVSAGAYILHPALGLIVAGLLMVISGFKLAGIIV